MRLALGVPSWCDGPELVQRTVDSLDGQADLVLVADGVVEGIVSNLPDVSNPSELPAPSDTVIVEQRRWASQGAKRDWLLQTAREHGCDWLLQLDSDERLHQAGMLREWLECWPADAFPLPFQFDRTSTWPPGGMIGATWKLIRVAAWERVVAQGAFFESARDGRLYILVPPDGGIPGFTDGLPYVSHHPWERPQGRREIRLSQLEDSLEPPVFDPPPLPFPTPSFDAVPSWKSSAVGSWSSGSERFYCDQCGRRYATPGICTVQHPARVVASLNGSLVAA